MTLQSHPDTVLFRTVAEQDAALDRVMAHLEAGGLIAYPTETVYGFGCMLHPDALRRLAEVKGRTEAKPFVLLVTGSDMLPGLEWTPAATALARRFWPGALTLALRVSGSMPQQVVSTTGTVAVRASPHPGVRRLLLRLGSPITSTSANLPGQPAALDAGQAGRALLAASGDRPVLVLDGGTLPPSPPSTIVDCSVDPPKLVRAGRIDASQLAETVHGIENARP